MLDILAPTDEVLCQQEIGQHFPTPLSLFVKWTGPKVGTPVVYGALLRLADSRSWVEFGTDIPVPLKPVHGSHGRGRFKFGIICRF